MPVGYFDLTAEEIAEYAVGSTDAPADEAECMAKEIQRLRAEVEAMRPVVEAAVVWRGADESHAFEAMMDTVDELAGAVDAYRASQHTRESAELDKSVKPT